MSKVHFDAFIEQALTAVHSRGGRSLRKIADDLHVNYYTIKNWIRRKSLNKLTVSANREKRPQDWTRGEQLIALHETHGMDDEAVQAWCRTNGLFAHHSEQWRASFCAEPKTATGDARELRIAQANNDKLQRDLDRRDKTLAEAASLFRDWPTKEFISHRNRRSIVYSAPGDRYATVMRYA